VRHIAGSGLILQPFKLCGGVKAFNVSKLLRGAVRGIVPFQPLQSIGFSNLSLEGKRGAGCYRRQLASSIVRVLRHNIGTIKLSQPVKRRNERPARSDTLKVKVIHRCSTCEHKAHSPIPLSRVDTRRADVFTAAFSKASLLLCRSVA
jgi:hypothetical protein